MFEKLKRFTQSPPSGAVEYLIVGLGNPGKEYERTRHNAGFMVIDKLCQKNRIKTDRLKFKSLFTDATINGSRALVMKPSTFMNNSGQAVAEAMKFYKIPPEKIIVVCDDISLDVGKMRIRRKGSHGGQNGLKNIIYLTGSDNFPRIKVGIGNKPHPDYDLAKWVLSRFTDNDMKDLDVVADNAVKAIEYIVSGQIDKAMNEFN